MGGILGPGVMGEDSYSEGRRFQSLDHKLNGHFSL